MEVLGTRDTKPALKLALRVHQPVSSQNGLEFRLCFQDSINGHLHVRGRRVIILAAPCHFARHVFNKSSFTSDAKLRQTDPMCVSTSSSVKASLNGEFYFTVFKTATSALLI